MVAVSGCQWLGDRWSGVKPLPVDGVTSTAKPKFPSADTASLGIDRVLLAKEDWIRTTRVGETLPGEKVWRWRHAGVEDLLARPPAHRPDFRPLLADEDPVVAANAAIAMARQGDPAALDKLIATVRTPARRLSLRCAAVESIASVQPAPVDRLGSLLDEHCRTKTSDGSAYLPELHAELLAALAGHVEPATDPHFKEAMGSAMVNVRLEAIRAWRTSRQPLPESLTGLRFNADPRVRAALMGVLGDRRPDGAEEWLASAVNDQDLHVRLAAMAALGQYGGEKAHAVLQKELASRHEAMRAGAVAALEASGDREALAKAAKDRSWEVRCVVAQCVGQRSDREASTLALQLLDDQSLEVQRRMLAAIKAWPVDRSGPLLLAAMEKSAYQTRKTAAEHLAAQWPPAAEFPIDAPQDRRDEVLQRLRARFRQEVGFTDGSSLADARAPAGRSTASVSPESAARAEQLVQKLSDWHVSDEETRQAVRDLSELGAELVPALEHVLFDRRTPLPEVVYRDVLPLQGPVFSALARLDSSESSERRRGASALAEMVAGGRGLPRLAVARLAERVTTETDPLVWLSALAVVARDPSDDAIRMAYAGVGHPVPEVRRRACLNLAAFPDPKHAKVLLPALDDPSRSVMVAAVQALGTVGHIDDPEPLRRQLTAANESIRFEVALALVRLDDPAGRNALERLVYSTDPTIRRQAAATMGEFPDRQFIPSLIAMLDDRAGVRNVALESLRKVVGPTETAHIEGKPGADSDVLVQRWKRWHRGLSPAEKTSDLPTVDMQVQVRDTP